MTRHPLLMPILFALLLVVAAPLRADETAAVPAQPPPINGFQVSTIDANIAPTVAVLPHTTVQVVGQPRATKGHPCTLWDQEDVDHYKEMLKTSKELQFQFAEMKAAMDARIATPVDIPPPPPGKNFPGDYFPKFPGSPANETPDGNLRRYMNRDSEAIADLGILYALTGDAKYGEYAKQLLLAYAHASQFAPFKNYNLRYGS